MKAETRDELLDIVAACRARHVEHGDFSDEEIEQLLLKKLDEDQVVDLMSSFRFSAPEEAQEKYSAMVPPNR